MNAFGQAQILQFRRQTFQLEDTVRSFEAMKMNFKEFHELSYALGMAHMAALTLTNAHRQFVDACQAIDEAVARNRAKVGA